MCVDGLSRLDPRYDSAGDDGSGGHGADDDFDADISDPPFPLAYIFGEVHHSSSYFVLDCDFDHTSHMDCASLLGRQGSAKVMVYHWCKHSAPHSQESRSGLDAVGGGFADCIADGKNVQSLVAGTDTQGLPSDVSGRAPVNLDRLVLPD